MCVKTQKYILLKVNISYQSENRCHNEMFEVRVESVLKIK